MTGCEFAYVMDAATTSIVLDNHESREVTLRLRCVVDGMSPNDSECSNPYSPCATKANIDGNQLAAAALILACEDVALEGVGADRFPIPPNGTSRWTCAFTGSEPGQRTIRVELHVADSASPDTSQMADSMAVLAQNTTTMDIRHPFLLSSSVLYTPLRTNRKPLLCAVGEEDPDREEIYAAEVLVNLGPGGDSEIVLESLIFVEPVSLDLDALLLSA